MMGKLTLIGPNRFSLPGLFWPRIADLGPLLHNLATAGALCAAFRHGFDQGWGCSGEGFNGEYTSRTFTAERYQRMRDVGGDFDVDGGYEWRPGCGRPMPGLREPADQAEGAER